MVCLTFDDGYSKASIVKILDCLRQNDVQCTFFVIGACLKKYPALWRQAVEDGNEIAYHTMKHHSLNGYSNKQIVRDINQWNETARNVLGAGYRIPKIARAPGGSANKRVRRLFNCLGYKLIYWSSDTYTGVYRRNKHNAGARIASYIIKKTAAGSISLQHFNSYDAASVSRYVAALKKKFTLGTVSEALAAGGG
jgi:peptidoglycan/xylan/chitin deacetylase (PgdA/CDA1 family)